MSSTINDAMIIKLDYELPEYPAFEAGIRRAPRRESHLSEADKALAIKNALRYIHPAGFTATVSAPPASCTASPSRSTRATAPRPRPSRS